MFGFKKLKKQGERIKELELENKILVKGNESVISENAKLFKENERLKLELRDKESKIEELEDRVYILNTFLGFEYNKKVDMYKKIKNRTKKARIKKKCDSKILDYQERLLVFER